MNSHRRLLIGWLQKVGVGFLALALGGYAVSTNAAESRESAKLVAWKIPFEGSGSRPVLVDGVLYVGSADGAVYALNPNTGETKWRFQTGESLPSADHDRPMSQEEREMLRKTGIRRVNMTPAVENGTVFIGSGDRSFYAIDAATGKKKWSYEAGFGMALNLFRPVPAPVVKNGTVYFVTDDGLHALDMLTGERRWLFEASEETSKDKYPPAGPILSDGVIFLTAGSRTNGSAEAHQRLYAVDAASGKTKWVTTIAVDAWRLDPRTAPATAKGLAFLAVFDPHQHSGQTASPRPPAHDGAAVYAISADDGQIRWKFSAPHVSGSPQLLVADKTIYFTTDKRLIAAELETGRQLWTFSPKTKIDITTYGSGRDGRPNLWADDQHVYVVIEWDVVNGKERRLQALDRTTGREKWLLAVKGGNTDIQMIHDGLIYAGGYYSGLQVIDPARGKMLWSFNGANPSETARLISGNRIFIISGPDRVPGPGSVSQTNYLYAIDKPAKFRRQTNEP